MLRIAICDDKKEYREEVSRFLEEYEEKTKCLLRCIGLESSFELLDLVEKGERYDIYILDVFLPGMTGISLATQLRQMGVLEPIVFMTTSKEYALEAYGVNAIQYLVKPLDKALFFQTMDKVIQVCATTSKRSILLKAGGEYHSIYVRNIMYCESSNNYQVVYLKDDEILEVRKTSSELYEQLRTYGGFYQCGKSYIINVAQMSKLSGHTVIMKNGIVIQIPRTSVIGLRNEYFDFYGSED